MKKQTQNEINEIMTSILISSLITALVIYLIYSFFIKRTISTPLDNLNKSIDYLISGEADRRREERAIKDDEIGQVMKRINKYFKKLKDDAALDMEVIEEVEDVISKVNNGFYVYKIEGNTSNPQIQKLKDSINQMLEKTNDNLTTLNQKLIQYGGSNFKIDSNLSSNSDVNGIISSINYSTQLLGRTVSEFLSMITASGRKLNDDTKTLSSSANDLSSSANEQAASLEETAAAIEEITSIITSNVEKVSKMSVLANDLQTSSNEGQDLASRTTKAMEDIDEQVNSINEAITVIDQIAFQTNILSLNAAVEAATAGEAGKGFAVVAQEVRNLASRSAEAAKEIKDIVEAATSKANEGKAIANDMIGGYTNLNSKINETIGLIEDVSTASREEEAGIVQINDAINALDQATQVNASSATTISHLAKEVSFLSDNLLKIADRAEFTEVTPNEIADIDLVFKVSKLKNDHIVFKNTNLEKVGSDKTAWSIKKPTECDLGKWIIEQETKGESFTKTSNWTDLKTHHVMVHDSVQEYINENAKGSQDNSLLEAISSKIDQGVEGVFKGLDQVKKDNVVKTTNDTRTIQAQVETRPLSNNTRPSNPVKSRAIQSPKLENKTQVFESKSSDDDEWESF